ncbi:MAG TPA: hypothetical protein VGM63_09480 [Mucilaginibacter sp.]
MKFTLFARQRADQRSVVGVGQPGISTRCQDLNSVVILNVVKDLLHHTDS